LYLALKFFGGEKHKRFHTPQMQVILSDISMNEIYFNNLKSKWVSDRKSLRADEKNFCDFLVAAVKEWLPARYKLLVITLIQLMFTT
jgi:hypothetical protein